MLLMPLFLDLLAARALFLPAHQRAQSATFPGQRGYRSDGITQS